MPRDLGQVLHDTAPAPSVPVEVRAVIARGRRRRRARYTTAGTLAVVVVALALAVVPLGPVGEPEVVFDPPPPSPPAAPEQERSQTPEDAARDGVVDEVAALPFDARVHPVEPVHPDGAARVTTDEGVWMASRLPAGTAEEGDGCGIGATDDPDARYRRDVVCDMEYGEVLLLDHDEQRILRAYPLAGLPPQGLLATEEAVYCVRQGDGGLPDSMLCRIDRQTGEWTVRVFPHPQSGSFPAPADHHVPEQWVVDEPVSEPLFDRLEFTDGGLVIGGRVRVDPGTLELLGG